MKPKERSQQPRPLTSSAAERIATIVEAAERAAQSVIDDAEAQARSYLSQAQADADRIASERLAALSGLTESLVAEAEAIRDRAERLVDSLEAAQAQFGADPAPEASSRGSHLSAVAPAEQAELAPPLDPQPRRGDGDRARDGDTPAGARLLATQMAVSGSSRKEIELRLKNGFEIDDTAAILDAILGPE